MHMSKNVSSVGRFVWKVKEPVKLAEPTQVADYVREHIFPDFDAVEQEEMWVLLLDTRYKVTYEVMIYRGATNMIPIRIVELFREAVRFNASYLILAHNHPSGEVDPSPEDVEITKRVDQGGELLGCKLLDHVIVGGNKHCSLKEKSLGL